MPKKEFLQYTDLESRESYEWYRKKRKRTSNNATRQYNTYIKAVKGLLTVIRDLLEQSEGGVYIEGWGYFFKLKVREFVRRNTFEERLLHQHKKVTYYESTFHPDPEFEGWTMDRTFERYIKDNLPEKYKIHFDIREAHRIAKQFERTRQENKFIPKYIYNDI